MKRQELDQLRQKSKTELLKDAAAIERDIVSMRMSKDQQVQTNVRAMGQLKRRLAAVKTIARQKA